MTSKFNRHGSDAFVNMADAVMIASGLDKNYSCSVIPIGICSPDEPPQSRSNGCIIALDFNRLNPVTLSAVKLFLLSLEIGSDTDDFPWEIDPFQKLEGSDRTLESVYRDIVKREFI